jgi:hypothetical protein
MLQVFDTVTGIVRLGNVTLYRDMTPQDLSSAGVIIDRVIDMKTGWAFRTTGPYSVLDRKVYVSLEFKADLLKRIGLSFCDKRDASIQTLFAEHTAFLENQLGPPNRRTNTDVIYDFGWGSISSGLDLRGGSSQILCVYP